MSVTFSAQTVTYSESVTGWPSFYTFIPEKIVGMNGFLYTFKNGRLYRHNSNKTNRNTYYGVYGPSIMKSVFNEAPLENKVFKTIGIQSDDAWSVTMTSDIQTTGFISGNTNAGQDNFFVQKEGEWFAFLRNNEANPLSGDFPLRSVQGIGVQRIRTGVGTNNCVLTFPTDIALDSMINQGDFLYYAVAPFTGTNTPIGGGEILQVDFGNNFIQINNTGGGTTALPASGIEAYIMYIKNPIAESHGILGHYAEFVLTNENTSAVELFAVDSDVMKSFP